MAKQKMCREKSEKARTGTSQSLQKKTDGRQEADRENERGQLQQELLSAVWLMAQKMGWRLGEHQHEELAFSSGLQNIHQRALSSTFP